MSARHKGFLIRQPSALDGCQHRIDAEASLSSNYGDRRVFGPGGAREPLVARPLRHRRVLVPVQYLLNIVFPCARMEVVHAIISRNIGGAAS